MSTTPVGRVAPSLRAHVAEEVRVLLARRRMTGVALAELVRRSQSYMSRRLTGETPFDVDDLQRIAEALGVTVADLLPREQRKTTAEYLPGERVIATIGDSNRPSRTRRPVRRRQPFAMNAAHHPATPVAV